MKQSRLFILSLLSMFLLTLALAQEPVTITHWTDPRLASPPNHPEFTSLADYEKAQAERFMEMHPHVTIEVQGLDWPDLAIKVPAALAAGNPPDILKDYLGRTSGYGHAGVTVDINTLVPAEEIADIQPGLIDLYTINGELHAMPAYFWAQEMVVNKALFDNAGLGDLVPVDDRDWTQEEFIDALRQLKAADPSVEYPLSLQVASEQGDYDFHQFLWGAGGEIWEADCSATAFDNEATLAGLEFVNQLYQEGLINPDATTASNQDKMNYFYTGKSAVVGGGIGTLDVELVNAVADGSVTTDMDAVMMMYPHAEGVVNGFPVGPTGFVVFDKGQSDYEMEWIAEYLMFLNSAEAQIDYALSSSQFPARISAGTPLADNSNYVRTLELISERGTENMGLPCLGFSEVRVAQPPKWQAMFLGQISPAEAAEQLQEETADIISNQ